MAEAPTTTHSRVKRPSDEEDVHPVTARQRTIGPSAISFDRLRTYMIEVLSLFIFMGLGRVRLGEEMFLCRIIRKNEMENYVKFEKDIQRILMNEPCPGVPTVCDLALQETCIFIVYSEDVTVNLHTRINDSGPFSEKDALKVFHQIVAVIAHLHSKKIIHRDIKLTRFAIRKTSEENGADEKSGAPEILAINFDSCRKIHPDTPYEEHHASPAYVAPEVLEASVRPNQLEALDMWSLGVLLYILVVGMYPFQDDKPKGLFEKIRKCEINYEHEKLKAAPKVVSLLRELLVRDPLRRLTAATLKSMLEHLLGMDQDQVVPSVEEKASPVRAARCYIKDPDFSSKFNSAVASICPEVR